MKKNFKIYQINVFTDKVFEGNPAGVVVNADGLSEVQMQQIARELNNSETAFIFSPSDHSHDMQVRFFTPTVEVPSCGHASIAAGYVRAKENGFNKKIFNQKIQIGILPLEVKEIRGKQKVFMTQGTPEFGPVLTGNLKDRILKALRVKAEDLNANLPIQTVTTGHGKAIIPLKDRSVLNSIEPDHQKLIILSEEIGENGFFPFALDNSEPGILTHTRMFAPKIGISEDPVTGNGNGPLGAYLAFHKVIPFQNTLEFISRQGEKIKRPGEAHVIVEMEGDQPMKVSVGGECVIAFKTSVELKIQKHQSTT